MQYVTPIIVLGLMGIVFASLLGIASIVFAVEQDPTEGLIREALPGANCGACGYPGCDGYAKACATNVAPLTLCAVGGPVVAQRLAEIMGVEAVETEKQVAQVFCRGNDSQTFKTFDYEGKNDCRTIKSLWTGTNKSCQYGCIGCGTCVNECEYGALSLVDGIAQIDKEKCVACKKCIKICPQNIIHLVPYNATTHIYCSSYSFGKDVKEVCKVGCIGCSLCVRLAPNEFEMDGKLSKVKYSKDFNIENARRAAEKCPAKCIIIDEDSKVEVAN